MANIALQVSSETNFWHLQVLVCGNCQSTRNFREIVIKIGKSYDRKRKTCQKFWKDLKCLISVISGLNTESCHDPGFA